MKSIFIILFFLILLCTFQCISIPPEAPELSLELGKRINSIQDTHLTLLNHYFDLKMKDIDKFIETEWIPVFTKKVMSKPLMKSYWSQITTSTQETDKIKFMIITGTKLQEEINQKRLELIQPLDKIKKEIEKNIRNAYSEATAINNSLTSFLNSAAKIAENRRKYLSTIGIYDRKISQTIDKVNDAVSKIMPYAQTTENTLNKTTDYLKKLKEIVQNLKNK